MPIDVTCTGCKTRFKVSDQFAGKKGPCPKCKAIISVPAASEQVVIHAPDQFGPKDSSGRSVLKPIFREETAVSLPVVIATVVTVVLVLAAAFWIRSAYKDPSTTPILMMALGAVALAPPVIWSGYAFLRDAELAPHRGMSLLVRVLICSAIYAALWGGHMAIKSSLFEGKPLQSYDLLYVVPPLVVAGGFTSFVSLELSFGIGVLHYSFYLLVTVLLRLLVRQPPF